MFKNYAFDYTHDNKTWGITIPAEGEDDAIKRLESISKAILLGEVFEVIP